MARSPSYSLAIETSGRVGSVALGRGDALLSAVELPSARRHNVELAATIDRVMADHGAVRTELAEVYVSIGPGSFTGLRVAVATAKMLALVLGAKLVAVPTLDVTAGNVPGPEGDGDPASLAVALNLKRATAYAGFYAWDADARRWQAQRAPALMTTDELLDQAPRPLALLAPMGAGCGDLAQRAAGVSDVVLLAPALLTADARVTWRLGRDLAASGCFVDPAALTPLYVRPPEAVELWTKRKTAAAGAS